MHTNCSVCQRPSVCGNGGIRIPFHKHAAAARDGRWQGSSQGHSNRNFLTKRQHPHFFVSQWPQFLKTAPKSSDLSTTRLLQVFPVQGMADSVRRFISHNSKTVFPSNCCQNGLRQEMEWNRTPHGASQNTKMHPPHWVHNVHEATDKKGEPEVNGCNAYQHYAVNWSNHFLRSGAHCAFGT